VLPSTTQVWGVVMDSDAGLIYISDMNSDCGSSGEPIGEDESVLERGRDAEAEAPQNTSLTHGHRRRRASPDRYGSIQLVSHHPQWLPIMARPDRSVARSTARC
jgi:hypothetical protein